jgi:succinate dehydrogenase hydrophobic membrane anchor protein
MDDHSPRNARASWHWLAQRTSGVLSGIFLVWALVQLHGLWYAPLEVWQKSLGTPGTGGPVLLGTFAFIRHAVLGVQVVIEDYMPRPWHSFLVRAVWLWGWVLAFCVLGAIATTVLMQDRAP